MNRLSIPRLGAWVLVAGIGAAPATAIETALHPTARQVVEVLSPDDALRLPVTPWQAGEVQAIRAEGDIRRRVWQVGSPGLTTQQMLAPLRAALESAGYNVLLECEARDCGGFEFRFETDALPPPEMYVDLGDYRFLAAQAATETGTAWAALMVSRSDTRGFVQLTQVTPPGERAPPASGPVGPVSGEVPVAPPRLGGVDVARTLIAEGSAVLWGLTFETGSAGLGPGPFAALNELAAFLEAHPEDRIVLVGHTDAEGALPGNIDLSRRRAASVRTRLIEGYGIAPARIRAEGVGYLSPLVPNATPEGREQNRRVEVILDRGR